ncbi:MAG: DUF3343 domain-containing protein [Clostridia bacterium]|nr:DUF3343 domain-containing protein [Clostridia bacterium]
MLVTIGSITTASRAAKVIRRVLGINVQVIHTPTQLNRGGCSYSIRFSDNYHMSVKRVISEYNIPVKRWYGESDGGVYNDLS